MGVPPEGGAPVSLPYNLCMNKSDVTDPTLQKMIALCEAEVPGFRIVYKDESPYMKFLNFFAQIFNKEFMTRYATTTGSTVYLPRDLFLANQRSYISTFAHELVHMREEKDTGRALYFMKYAMPQLLGVFALLALLGFWSPWFLFFLIMLAFVAPIPSIGRKNIELRGYTMSLAVTYWMYGTIREDEIQFYAAQFSGSAYWFMWPWHDQIVNDLKLRAISIRTDEVLKDPLYRKVREVVKR